jgi:release factor glutamine methyltransferase
VRRAEDLLHDARRRLAAVPFEPAPREASLLLARVLGLSEAALLARPESPVGDDQVRSFEALLERRLAGEPVAYLLGEKEFYGRAFLVDRRVLVPRPETEHLVETVIARAAAFGAPRVHDLGTGSGCVAITVALEVRGARVTASDLSLAALAVASANRARHRAAVSLVASRTLDGIDATAVDLLVANLPYLDPARTAGLAMEVLRWEPPGALFGGAGGLERFRDLFQSAPRLRRGAVVALEIGADQADAVGALAAQYHLRRLETVGDYGGHDRVLILER